MTDHATPRSDALGELLCELCSRGMESELPVHGDSMQPILRSGDRVRLAPARSSDVRVGDIVIRVGASGVVVHRLVARWPRRGVLTKGDATARFDARGECAEVVGRVVARIRKGKVLRLDTTGQRFRGRGRAVVSLVEGLMLVLWTRGVRLAGRRRA